MRKEIIFLSAVYLISLFLRLVPRLDLDPFLLTFNADIWYRLCMAQYVLDHNTFPAWDIRYEAYGQVPFWYNPWAIHGFVFLSKLFSLDLPVVTSRIVPFLESFAALPLYFLCRYLYGIRVAVIATVFLALTPSFVYWSGIATPQSFTLFLLPFCILLWVRFVEKKYVLSNKGLHLGALALFLAVSFLVHLTFFNLIIILFAVQAALVREKRSPAQGFFFLLIPVAASQILTAGWWLPKNLYWWWTQAISTSTAFFDGKMFLQEYGTVSAILGHLAFVGLLVIVTRKKKFPKYYLIPVYWALYPFIESHMEGFLALISRGDLVWNAFLRPIEGFRFYSFLAQPLAICVALVAENLWTKHRRNVITAVCVIGAVLLADLYRGFNFPARIRHQKVSLSDIDAARWFRVNAQPDDRIVADYYTAQMFGGICGGKALLGALFPLKKGPVPYITGSWRVLEDIHQIYASDDAGAVKALLERYGVTHVYFSVNSLRLLEFAVNGYGDYKGLADGKFDVLVHKDYTDTLMNDRYFTIVYEKDGIRILRIQE